MPPPSQWLVTALTVVATALVQLAVQLTLGYIADAIPGWRPRLAEPMRRVMLTVTAIFTLMTGHLVQVGLWALRYYSWGELGGFVNSAYFSLASFTTVGANELQLSPMHRMTGAIEAATGMLMFGWSTALLVSFIQKAERLKA